MKKMILGVFLFLGLLLPVPSYALSELSTIDNNTIGVSINMFDYDAEDIWDNNPQELVDTRINSLSPLKFFGHGGSAVREDGNENEFTGDQTVRQGIVQNKLNANGFPVLYDGTNLDILFDNNTNDYKRVYKNLNHFFQKEAGIFSYNSDIHYAYYDISQGNNGNFKIYDSSYKIIGTDSNGDPTEEKVGFYPFNSYDEKAAEEGGISKSKINGNRIDWSSFKYDFTLTQWQFLKEWSYQTWFTTNDFRDLRFYYQAPLDADDGSTSTIQIIKSKDKLGIENDLQPLHTQNLIVKQGAPEIKLNGTIILEKKKKETNQIYNLSSNESILNADWSVNVGKLQKLDISMKDLQWNLINDLDSQVMVTSKNGLVVAWEVHKWGSWKNEFFETSMHHMVSGHVLVYYYPTTVAWEDVIEIDIPWLESRYINLSVKPAALHTVKLKPQNDVLSLWDSMWLEIFLYDVWGNMLDWNPSVGLTYDEEKVEIQWGIDWSVTVPVPKWYAKVNMRGIWAWLTYVMAGSEYAKFTVDKHIFPDSGLNIMYLNYFGNDWWNQWWYLSANDRYVEGMMDRSKKLITTTTLLASEDKLKKWCGRLRHDLKFWVKIILKQFWI